MPSPALNSRHKRRDGTKEWRSRWRRANRATETARVKRWRARNPQLHHLRQWWYNQRYQAMRRMRLMEGVLACALP
jgi:hypothetical protein